MTSQFRLIFISQCIVEIVDSSSEAYVHSREADSLMIPTLVQSAFQTGYLSVESEGLIRQILRLRSCKKTDLEALASLYEALNKGEIRREAHDDNQLPVLQ